MNSVYSETSIDSFFCPTRQNGQQIYPQSQLITRENPAYLFDAPLMNKLIKLPMNLKRLDLSNLGEKLMNRKPKPTASGSVQN